MRTSFRYWVWLLGMAAVFSVLCPRLEAQVGCPVGYTRAAFTTPGTTSSSVPSGVTSAQITAVGADGAGSNRRGGSGATVTATFPVTGGGTLSILVGGKGSIAGSGAGGGGGGGSFAATDNSFSAGSLLVAAGGGGGGGTDATVGPAMAGAA